MTALLQLFIHARSRRIIDCHTDIFTSGVLFFFLRRQVADFVLYAVGDGYTATADGVIGSVEFEKWTAEQCRFNFFGRRLTLFI